MSEIRELAMRLAVECGIKENKSWGYFHGQPSDIERLVRAAMREGMMRAADICHNIESEDYAEERCADAIRSEAAKLETN